MSRRTQNRNQFETTTTGELASGAFSVAVVSTTGLDTLVDMYLVIEPDVPGQREWVKVDTISGLILNITNPGGRDLTGSDGDLTHPAGSKVRSVPTSQIFDDIFQDIEDNELADTQHETDGGDPHAAAGYLKEADGDLIYVQLAGSTLDALAFIDTPETTGFADTSLVPKVYVDTQDATLDAAVLASAQAYSDGLDHDHDTPIGVHAALPDVHHVAFVAADADLLYLQVDGGNAMAANLDMGNATIVNLNPGALTGHAVEFDQFEAANDARVLLSPPLAGLQTITGDLTITGNLVVNDPITFNDDLTMNGGLEITQAAQNLLQDLVRNVVINDGAPPVAVRGSMWLDPTDASLFYSDGAAWQQGIIPLPLNINAVHTMIGRALGPAGGTATPAWAVGNSTSGVYQEGSFIGLTRNSVAVVVGNGTDQIYMSGIVSGTGDALVGDSTQIKRIVSSRRFKNVGSIIDKAAIRAKLMALPVYEWAYKNEPDEEQIGWMAEDVAEVDPRLVNWNDEGKPSSIRTLAIMAVLT